MAEHINIRSRRSQARALAIADKNARIKETERQLEACIEGGRRLHAINAELLAALEADQSACDAWRRKPADERGSVISALFETEPQRLAAIAKARGDAP